MASTSITTTTSIASSSIIALSTTSSIRPVDTAAATSVGWKLGGETSQPWASDLGIKDPCSPIEGPVNKLGCDNFFKAFGLKSILEPVGQQVDFTKLRSDFKCKLIGTNRGSWRRTRDRLNPRAPPIKTKSDQLALPCGLVSIKDVTGDSNHDIQHPKHTRRGRPEASVSAIDRSGSLAWKAEMLRREINSRSNACTPVKFAGSTPTASQICKRGHRGKACTMKPHKAKGAHGKTATGIDHKTTGDKKSGHGKTGNRGKKTSGINHKTKTTGASQHKKVGHGATGTRGKKTTGVTGKPGTRQKTNHGKAGVQGA